MVALGHTVHITNLWPTKGSTMGCFTEGSDHEGYVVCVFADGMYGASGKHRQDQGREL